jgi:hypothetical protein
VLPIIPRQQAQCNELGVMVHTWALYLETIIVSRSYSKRERDKVSHSAASSKNKGSVVGVRAVGVVGVVGAVGTCVK